MHITHGHNSHSQCTLYSYSAFTHRYTFTQTHTITQTNRQKHTFSTWLCTLLLEIDDAVFLTPRCSTGGDDGGVVSNSASSSSLSVSSPLMAATVSYDTNEC